MRREEIVKRKLKVAIVIICILGVWLKNVYDDKNFIESDIDLYKITLCNKDTLAMGLYKTIDSLKKVKRKTKTVFVYPPKKEVKRALITPIDTIPIIDTTLTIKADTIKLE